MYYRIQSAELKEDVYKRQVLVNEKSSKANYKVHENDCITINIPEPVTANIEPENIPLDILYEDDDLSLIHI